MHGRNADHGGLPLVARELSHQSGGAIGRGGNEPVDGLRPARRELCLVGDHRFEDGRRLWPERLPARRAGGPIDRPEIRFDALAHLGIAELLLRRLLRSGVGPRRPGRGDQRCEQKGDHGVLLTGA